MLGVCAAALAGCAHILRSAALHMRFPAAPGADTIPIAREAAQFAATTKGASR